MMVQPNYTFRANSPNPDERRAVEDAFAKSILWGFTVGAETDGRVLVDATDFFLRDAHNVMPRLRPGTSASIARAARSTCHGRKGFPKNTEVDVILTFVERRRRAVAAAAAAGRRKAAPGGLADPGGGGVRRRHVLRHGRQRHAVGRRGDAARASHVRRAARRQLQAALSTIRAPATAALQYVDYAAPLGAPMVQRFVRRHRLEKVDPSARVSDAKKPIVYYVDRGTPEPIRSALLEGAGWWNQAFEAAGYRNAFRVELLPEGADPMDIRYNMINWVHRSTRGWSYGRTISDPRTGEIIKATVTLGSLRDRQDYLIFEGLLAPYKTGTETPAILAQTAIARIRQLAAHEVGHTLGLGHEYYNSTKGRISVMDYPHPLEKLNADGTIDLSDAYAVGIGEWDKVAIAYGYQDFPKGTDEPAALKKILDDAWAQDLRLHDQPGHRRRRRRSTSGTTAPTMAAELTRIMKVRRAALNRFDETVIKKDAADGDDGRGAGAAVHVSPLRGRSGGVGGRRPGLHLRLPRRWPHADQVGAAAQQQGRARRAGGHAKPSELALPKNALDKIPPRPSGWAHASRAVRALHRRRASIRSARPRSPPTSPSASCCSPIAPRAWSRSTRIDPVASWS